MKWQQEPLKYVTRFNYGDAPPRSELDGLREGPIKIFGSNGPFANYSIANTKAPAIIVGRKGSYGKINWSSEPCFASDTTFFIDSSTTKHHLRWLFYVLQTLRLDQGTDEAAVPGLNREDAYEKAVLVPPLATQRTIANYLDRETAKIDAMIAVKQRLLELLAEKRRALITHAVTRGLDPAAPRRDSGVAWLGEVPAHWDVEFARWLFTLIDVRSSTGKEDLLSVSHLTGVTLRSEKDVNMFMAESLEGYKICQPGDLVINTLWAWMGAMGIASQVGLISPDYHVYRPSSLYDARYLDFLVRMPIFATEVTRYSKGVWSSRLRLYPEEFFEIGLPIPPLTEQVAIIEYLQREIENTDTLGASTQKSIELLHERRAALIAAAVTGQLEVAE